MRLIKQRLDALSFVGWDPIGQVSHHILVVSSLLSLVRYLPQIMFYNSKSFLDHLDNQKLFRKAPLIAFRMESNGADQLIHVTS